jgi:hypothetical protein
MSGLAEEYTKEARLFELYTQRAEYHKKRMESIKYLMDGSVDELDVAASMMIGNAAINTPTIIKTAHADVASSVVAGSYPKKRMSDRTVQLFRFLGTDGKELSELTRFAEQNGLGWKDHNIRNMMMQYRKNYEFIASSRSGFYSLTQKGLDAINKQSEIDSLA